MATEIALSPKAVEIQDFLKKQISDLTKACPKHLTPERLIQVASVCLYRNPALQDCDPASLLTSVIQASSLGLDISPGMGEAYLIPRWNSKARCNEAQFQPGYRGLVKLARQAGGINYIQAEIVRKKDVFRAYRDPDWKIHHEPFYGKEGGSVTHVYAIAKLANSEYQIVVMSRDEVEDIRGRSQSANAGPWKTDWNEMAKKTCLKRLCKGLPTNADPAAAFALNEAIEHDNADYEEWREGSTTKAIDNNSGFAKGKYASPQQTEVFLQKMDAYLEKRNSEWLDRWTANGEVPAGLKEYVCNRWQADNHLVKWAVSVGHLAPMDVETGVKNAQIGRFTAIIYHRSKEDQKALTMELKRYVDEQERIALERLQRENPELFEPEEADEDPLDGLTEDNFEDEPGSDG